ncbi:MAG: DUF115 domain-containing protein, partial [Leptospiraceae bacterium]|nr:DUF115 domain-containing protein [Leptospiraceae bacterium]
MQNSEIWNRNKKFLNDELINQIENLEHFPTLGEVFYNNQNLPILRINDILFHSQHDPIKEAKRLLESLKQSETEKLYIFFGAGLGYIVLEALKSPKLTVIWMEQTLSILRFALNVFDFSEALKSQRLKILTPPFYEEKLYTAFKGLGNLPTTFIPHKPSFQWKLDEYNELKLICEKFFHKKNANIATLSKFEGVWTRNIFQNLPFILKMKPISLLFNLAEEIPILVVGAGPSLYYDLEKIKKFKNYFLIIVVDTAFHILKQAKIEPDLVYTVDPQVINKNYLEPYNGEGFLICDPTCNYHTLRLHPKLRQGFFFSSPFPLFQIFSKFFEVPVGGISFGGSVSTNAASL